MAHAQLVDPRGNPVSTADLRREFAAPQVAGVRQVWSHSVASGMTPATLAQTIQSADSGAHHAFLTLAEEIEERDAHYRSVLGTRKLAVSGLEVIVEAASEDAGDVERADAVRELTEAPEFGGAVDDLLDALGKGYSAVEINWRTDGPRWIPAYAHRDARFFQFDKATRRELRIRDESDHANGLALPPYKFIVHVPRLKTGLPIRGGLARLGVWAYLFKAFAVKDWAAFMEVYGIPMRIGRYGTNATDDDIKKLVSAVVNLGSDAAAVIHESMQIEFQNAVGGKGGNSQMFEQAANWWDKQTSKAVLGQTASTEGTPGKLGNEEAQSEVRRDILEADARQLSHTLSYDLARPFIDLNFGPQDAYPRIVLFVPQPEDTKALTDSLAKLVPLGFRVGQKPVREKLGLPEPEDDEELFTATSAPEPAPEGAANMAGVCPIHGIGGTGRLARPAIIAHNAGADSPTGFDALDDIEAEALAEWEEVLAPIVNPVRELIASANSYEELVAGLEKLIGKMETRGLVKELATAFFKARGAGDAKDNP